MKTMTPDDWGIKELQNCILNITKYIHDFCEQYGIEYFMAGGTLLGAVRHKGFIPWDDDLDLFMTPENYEKFRDCFEQYGDKDKYYLQQGFLTNEGMINWAKIRLNNSTYIEEPVKNMDIHHGVFVDIFLLHNCPESKIKQKWLSFWEKYLSFKDLANKEYHRKGGLWGMVLNIQKLLPKRFLVKYALKQVYRYKSEECPYRCHLYDNIPLYKGIYPKEWFGHSVLMPFENTELYGMGEYADVYLKAFYGDYMKIPSLEQIRYKQHSSEWSTEKPFTPRKSGSFADEKYL